MQSKNDLGKRPAEEISGGSRFSPLIVEGEGNIDFNVSNISIDGAKSTAHSFKGDFNSQKERKEAKSKGALKDADEVRINVSHVSLLKILRPLGRSGRETKTEAAVGGLRRLKL